MEGYNKKVIMSYWTICRMKTTKKIYVKVSIIFLLGGILLFSSCEKEENQKIEANRKTWFFVKFGGNLFFISPVFFFLNPIKSCRYVCFLVTLKTPHH